MNLIYNLDRSTFDMHFFIIELQCLYDHLYIKYLHAILYKIPHIVGRGG